MKNIFTKHPNAIGETYLQHLVKGVSFSIKLLVVSFKVFIHAILPCFFENSASDKVSELNDILQKRRKKG